MTVIRCFTLAEHAVVANGRLHLAGVGIASMRTDEFPTTLPVLGVGAELTTVLRPESTILLRMLAPSAVEVRSEQSVVRAEGVPSAQRAAGVSTDICLAWMLHGVDLPAAGEYALLLEIDGMILGRVAFDVLRSDQAQDADVAQRAADSSQNALAGVSP